MEKVKNHQHHEKSRKNEKKEEELLKTLKKSCLSIAHVFLSVSRSGDVFCKFWNFSWFEHIFRKSQKSNLNTQKTNINRCVGGRGVSTNDSSYGFPPWGWSQTIFLIDK